VVEYRQEADVEFITGRSRNQIVLLPDNMEEYAGDDSAVWVTGVYINGLELSSLEFSRPQPRSTGRPGYDPEDLLKLYAYGYKNRIRFSRRLEAECGSHVAFG
jgi:transposase